MKFIFIGAFIFCGYCSNASALEARLAPNQMQVRVGGLLNDGTNVPLVSVTICEPGTRNCRTIDRIQLDTASVGLRLFSSLATGLNLPAVKGANKQSIFECTSYGGGDSYWGPVRLADVKLGGEIATNVRVQTWQDPPGGVNCSILRDHPQAGEINGILGVSFAHDDCADVGSDNNCGATAAFHYYTCDGSHCSALNDLTSLAVSNPLMSLPRDNNGYLIEFPNVAAPQATVAGTLTLGLNTLSDNRLGAIATHEIPLPANGWFHLKYEGQDFLSRFDTGSDSYYLPVKFGLPMCTYFCPNQPTDLHLSVVTGRTVTPFNIEISDPGDATDHDRIQVIPDIANLLDGSPFLIGMPFFYGKKIYFGLARDKTSTGFVAF